MDCLLDFVPYENLFRPHLSDVIDATERLSRFMEFFHEAFSRKCSQKSCVGTCEASTGTTRGKSSVCSRYNIASIQPSIIRYWSLDRYPTINPFLISIGSDIRYDFVCPKPCGHHVFSSKVSNFVISGNCPFCTSAKCCLCTSAKALIPHIEEWFDVEKNKEVGRKFDLATIPSQSNESYWFRCPTFSLQRNSMHERMRREGKVLRCQNPYEHHRWERPMSVVYRHQICPYCDHDLACPCNTAVTQNPFLKELLDTDSPSYEENLRILQTYPATTTRRVDFKCLSSKHRFNEIILNVNRRVLVVAKNGKNPNHYCLECRKTKIRTLDMKKRCFIEMKLRLTSEEIRHIQQRSRPSS